MSVDWRVCGPCGWAGVVVCAFCGEAYCHHCCLDDGELYECCPRCMTGVLEPIAGRV